MIPPPLPPSPESLQDAEHLRLLAVGHYVLAGVTALFSCFPFMHIAMGTMMLAGKFPMQSSTALPPGMTMMGWFFVIIGSFIVLLGWSLAAAMFLAARRLTARKNFNFCFVVACIECLNMPLGTILGIFTITVLQRPGVRGLFDEAKMPAL